MGWETKPHSLDHLEEEEHTVAKEMNYNKYTATIKERKDTVQKGIWHKLVCQNQNLHKVFCIEFKIKNLLENVLRFLFITYQT